MPTRLDPRPPACPSRAAGGRAPVWVALLSAWAGGGWACGGGDGSAGSKPAAADPQDSALPDVDLGDPATTPLRGACPAEQRRGGFQIDVGERYSAVSGNVADGVLPASVPTAAGAEGECRLEQRTNPFCDPPCAPDEACGRDGACQPYPLNVDLGLVRILGLNAAVELSPVPPGTTYFDTRTPHPVVEPDALVRLQTEGGALEPLELHGLGAEPLRAEPAVWRVGDGDLRLQWTPPQGLGRSLIEARLMIDQHGISPLTLVCELADDGEATLPDGLIQRMLGAGVSGFPNGTLRRRTADRVELNDGGCVDLVVSTSLVPEVEVADHTPCTEHADCPPGQLCNFALETCQ